MNHLKPEHRIEETDVVKSLRKQLADDTLFHYRHAITGNWMLCHWMNKDKKQFNEIMVTGVESPGERVTSDTVEMLRAVREPVNFKEIASRIQKAELEGEATELEAAADMADAQNWLGKKGYGNIYFR